MEDARRQIATAIGAESSEIVFTSGGTEANNAIVSRPHWQRLFVSAIEHDSVRLVRADAHQIPVSVNGIVDVEWLERALRAESGPTLVSVMLANNETGVIQPIAEIARVVHAAQASLHCDAVQACQLCGAHNTDEW